MLGVITGILVGEASLLLPGNDPALRIGAMTLLAMLAALPFGLIAAIPIQASVSALLVVVIGPVVGGPTRLLDVALGTGVALLFSQVLLTPDPVRQVERAAGAMLLRLADALDRAAEALATKDQATACIALEELAAVRDSLVALRTAIATAHSNARWSLRGRLAKPRIAGLTTRYDQQAQSLLIAALLFGAALADAIGKAELPSGLPAGVAHLAARCRRTEEKDEVVQLAPPPMQMVAPEWHSCMEHLRVMHRALGGLQHR